MNDAAKMKKRIVELRESNIKLFRQRQNTYARTTGRLIHIPSQFIVPTSSTSRHSSKMSDNSILLTATFIINSKHSPPNSFHII